MGSVYRRLYINEWINLAFFAECSKFLSNISPTEASLVLTESNEKKVKKNELKYTNKTFTVFPDEPFPSFGDLKSVDRRVLCCSGTSCDGF